jgi:hypothetical protein
MKKLITIAMFAGLLWLEIPLSAQDQQPAQSAPASPSNPPAAGPPGPKPKPAAKKNPPAKAPVPGHKVVVRNGGAKDQSAQLAPGMSKEQELQSRQATTHLLATTDVNVKSVAGRQLTPAQQGMLDQIRTYMKQSKQASDSGDLARAHTLANKAHLLSDELVKK